MSKLNMVKELGGKLITRKRMTLAALVIGGLYMFGSAAASYLSTASRLVSASVQDSIPLEFEIERAKTMINDLLPEIKNNMIVIAKEEASAKSLRQQVERDQLVLSKRKSEIKQLAEMLKSVEKDETSVKINDQMVDVSYANEQLSRMFERFKWDQDTIEQRARLLASQESSLAAARLTLEEKLHAKRDLEVELENLDARLFSVQRESVTSNISFDDTKFSRCQNLVQNLRTRLDVAEQLVATGSPIEFGLSSRILEKKDVLSKIDAYFLNEELEKGLAHVQR